tara:strand:+ start:2281 stop:6849 length:4569 start_codon:yes stop_codon:yes gene_type:complete
MKNRIIYWGGNENTIIPRMGACGDGTEGSTGAAAGAGKGATPGNQTGGNRPQKPKAHTEASTVDKAKASLAGALGTLAAGALAVAAVAGAIILLKKKPPLVVPTLPGPGPPTGPPTPENSKLPSETQTAGSEDPDAPDDPPTAPAGKPPEEGGDTPTPTTDEQGNKWAWVAGAGLLGLGAWALLSKGAFQPKKPNLPNLPTAVSPTGQIYQFVPSGVPSVPATGVWNQVALAVPPGGGPPISFSAPIGTGVSGLSLAEEAAIEAGATPLTESELIDGSWEEVGATGTDGPPTEAGSNISGNTVFTDEDGNVWVWEDPNWILDTIPEFVGQEIVDGNGNLWKYKDPPGAWINFGDVEPRFITTNNILPIKEPFVAKVIDVISSTDIILDESWTSLGTKVGSIGGYEPTQPEWKITYLQNEDDLYTYLLFGDDKSSLITNFKGDVEKYTEYPYSVVYKLYEEIPEGTEEGDLCYVVKEMAPPYTENVRLIDFVEEDIDAVVLRNPSWDTDTAADAFVTTRNTSYLTYNDLVSTDTSIKEAVENEIISGSFMESIELTGIDYRHWDNFIHFSSVEDRLKNFKTKMLDIESKVSESNSLSGISGSLTYEYTASLLSTVKKIKNEFTPFENHMYFGSSSYISSSIGEFHDTSWPKSGGTGTTLSPYIPYPVTASQATSWYDDQIISASLYDRNNKNRLINNIPKHVVDDSRNLPFHTFINMTGEYFDGIWSYIKEIDQIHDRKQKLTEGLSRDLIYAVGTSLGFYFNDGQDLVSLPTYVLGQEATGSNANTFTEYSSVPTRNISREIWKRLLTNMPFFLKTKGTLRSFKGLINCYGIPSSILRVKEYGGPDPDSRNQPSYDITRNFTKALDFKGGQYVSTTWANDSNSSRKPDTIEFRFRSGAPSGSYQTLYQAGTLSGGFAIALKDDSTTTDNIGSVAFRLGGHADHKGIAELSSSALPIYDGEFYSVMLTRVSSSGAQLTADTTSQDIEYRLYVKKYDEGRSKIYLSSYTTMTIDGDTSSSWNSSYVGDETGYIGGSPDNKFGTQLSGSMMEFRYWNTALNSGSFDNHVRAPKTFDGNHASASWTDLVLRYSFNSSDFVPSGEPRGNENLDVDDDIRDTSADQSYFQTGSAKGYTSGNRPHFRSFVDQEMQLIPNVGPNRRVKNKIRLESSKLAFGGLSVDKRSEVSAYDLASLDSNKLGIYFSPADVINEDIIRSVANLDFDQYIGDPRDKYKYRYRTLEDISTTYWQKYNAPNNFWDYIRLIRYYDSSIFEQLRKFVPARARASVGLLIEPNILERKKEVVGKQPTFDDIVIRGEVNVYGHQSQSAIYPTHTGSLPATLPTPTGSYLSYETSASFFDTTFLSGSLQSNYSVAVTSSMFRDASLYILSSSSAGWRGGKENYGDAIITKGGPEYVFREVLQPNITGSRISDHNYYKKYTYTSSLDELNDWGAASDWEHKNHYSSSYHRSDMQSVGHDNVFFRVAYGGSVQTKKTTLDLENPVSIVVTSPTTLITQEPGESKLKVK